MKKLLPSRKSCIQEDRSMRFQNDPPKRTLTSSWDTRNDSTNINSILHPDRFVSSPKQSSGSKTTETATKGVYKKCILGENTCYCRDKKIRPKLMSKPKTCLSMENKKQNIGSGLLRQRLKSNPILYDCRCKDSTTTFAGSDFAENNQGEIQHKCSCLRYTQNRKDYEVFRIQQEEEDSRRLENFDESISVEDNKEEDKKNNSYSLSTLMGTNPVTTETTSESDLEEEHQSVTDLADFRKEHYFETHTTDNLGKDIPSHTCVHQFKLDDRLLPEPLKTDPYGRSRCSICSKPMEGERMQLSKPYFGEGRPSSVSLKNLARCSELGLAPRSISIGGDKSKIELRIDPREKSKFGMFVGKMKKPEYFNTFALRQQRMSC